MTTVLLAALIIFGIGIAFAAGLFFGAIMTLMGSDKRAKQLAALSQKLVEAKDYLEFMQQRKESAPEKRRRGEAPNQREAVH